MRIRVLVADDFPLMRAAVVSALKGSGARRVLDLGCGEGKLLRLLAQELVFEEIVGLDVSTRSIFKPLTL